MSRAAAAVTRPLILGVALSVPACLLAAFGVLFANRPIYMYFLFPVPARIFVLITGAITLLLSVTSSGGQMAHLAHLGGLAARAGDGMEQPGAVEHRERHVHCGKLALFRLHSDLTFSSADLKLGTTLNAR